MGAWRLLFCRPTPVCRVCLCMRARVCLVVRLNEGGVAGSYRRGRVAVTWLCAVIYWNFRLSYKQGLRCRLRIASHQWVTMDRNYTARERERQKERDRDINKERARQTDRQIDWQRVRETERNRHRASASCYGAGLSSKGWQTETKTSTQEQTYSELVTGRVGECVAKIGCRCAVDADKAVMRLVWRRLAERYA